MLKLMKENDMTPSHIWDPNIIDGYSSKEIAEAISKGQLVFKVDIKS